MRLFASEVMPTLQRDAAFKMSIDQPQVKEPQAEDIFVPA